MAKQEIEFKTGNFKLDISGNLNPENTEKALNAGLTYIVQRDVASGIYVELEGVENNKGKKRLPKDFERKSLEFNEENAAAFKEAAEKVLGNYGDFTVSVSEHVPGESTSEPGVMAKAMWAQMKDNNALKTNLGIAADATDEIGIAACAAFLGGLRKSKKANGEEPKA